MGISRLTAMAIQAHYPEGTYIDHGPTAKGNGTGAALYLKRNGDYSRPPRLLLSLTDPDEKDSYRIKERLEKICDAVKNADLDTDI